MNMKNAVLTMCITFIVLFCSMSCTQEKKSPLKNISEVVTHELSVPLEPTVLMSNPENKNNKPELEIVKNLTEQLKFMASVEKEVFKILLPDQTFSTNQFEVLALAGEKFLDIKTGLLAGYECQKINFEFEQISSSNINVLSRCLKLPKKLAKIHLGQTSFEVQFPSQEWVSILGSSAQLSPQDRVCRIDIKNKKIERFNCEHTMITLNKSSADINLNELRLLKYQYDRSRKNEIEIEGGQFKDLVQIKKISLMVPISGKIKYSEKQLKIKDDFADMQKKLLGEQQNAEKTQDIVEGKAEISKEKNKQKTESENSQGVQQIEDQSEGQKTEESNPNQNENQQPTNVPATGPIDYSKPTFER